MDRTASLQASSLELDHRIDVVSNDIQAYKTYWSVSKPDNQEI